MSKTVKTSNDLIDDLIRTTFGAEPDVMACMSHGDEQVRLRLLPENETSSDPLDGLEVFWRRTVAASLAMREHRGAVSLLTERQARAVGWPTARMANLSLVLAWALFVAEPAGTYPLLTEADEEAEGPVSPLVGPDEHLPSIEKLLATQAELRRMDLAEVDRSGFARRQVPIVQAGKLVHLGNLLERWLGINAGTVELPSDQWAPRLENRNARAVGVLAWIAATAVELGHVFTEERIMAVRLKTDGDATLAGEPGATAANLALLLAAAANQGAGVTVHFLPPTADHAAALVRAGRQIERQRQRSTLDRETTTVRRLELQDLAARGFVHVGRGAAMNVADRLFR